QRADRPAVLGREAPERARVVRREAALGQAPGAGVGAGHQGIEHQRPGLRRERGLARAGGAHGVTSRGTSVSWYRLNGGSTSTNGRAAIMADTSVLIVGGSLNGLTTAALLAQHGVRSVVVERHPDTTVQYKFRGISPRSMEIYRSLGIEAEIRAHRS